ncbi:response regulator transcription factor [Bacillus sp. D386]|uniref:response regulator transcription factor n=1 Tax=Bacillus sp. D386 TaxID=2587155 RepID=UPI0011224AB0|nr:response regulator transcription factor [Bacillus sp. D386]
MKQRILIIEDEPQLARLLQLELQFEKFESDIAHTGREGLDKFKEGSYDLVLLDLMLPELNGMEVLQQIRNSGSCTPIILLTAKNEVKDKVAGLNLGANDYVTKPFEFEELLARIRVNLRFSPASLPTVTPPLNQFSFGPIQVNLDSHDVLKDGKVIELTPREFDLLVHFIRNARIVQTREQILDAVWGFDYYGDTNVVDVYVRYLRQKLGNQVIQTVRSVGYVMKEE